jgi:hypothetical protein
VIFEHLIGLDQTTEAKKKINRTAIRAIIIKDDLKVTAVGTNFLLES